MFEFLVHVATGTALFILIAIPSVGLSFLASSDLIASTSSFMALTFQWLSRLLFLVDTFLLVMFVVRGTIDTAKKLSGDSSEGSK